VHDDGRAGLRVFLCEADQEETFYLWRILISNLFLSRHWEVEMDVIGGTSNL
jgi:hypothetical protein